MNNLVPVLLAFLAGCAAVLGWLSIRRMLRRRDLAMAQKTAAGVLQQAEADVASRLEAADREARLRLEAAEARIEEESNKKQRDVEERRADLERREKDLRRRMAFADQRMAEVEKREAAAIAAQAETEAARQEAAALVARQRARLEQIAGLTARDARQELMREMESEARREAASTITRMQEEARERADEEARWLTTLAMQRLPLSQFAETTVTVVTLPSEEMKGRIIGREGRNIRSIEMSTGIDLIIDDTPGAIILSSFDPARRAIARQAIERLVEDGRIHPARIEEVVAKVREEFDRAQQEQGEAASFELGLHDLNPRLLKLLGRLKYLSREGQSLLDRSREVALIGSVLAGMIGARAEIAKRAGLLSRVGYADDAGLDRSPALLSADLATRLGESEAVVHCIQALHGAIAPRTLEAVLVQVADRAAAARPGARKEMLQSYLDRLGDMETIARSFPGVKEAFAVRAGKELRIIVDVEKITDKEVVWLSKDIAGRIEKEHKYPGQVRVSVIRETRSVDFAM